MTHLGLRKIYDCQRYLQLDTVPDTFIKNHGTFMKTEMKFMHWSEK